MRRVALVLFSLLVVLYQGASEAVLSVRGAPPSLPWIFVAYVAVYGRRREAMLVATSVGIAMDLLSADPFGSHTAALIVWVQILAACADRRLTEHALPLAAILVSTWPVALSTRVAIVWIVDGLRPDLAPIVLSALLSLAASWPVFAVLHGIASRILEPPRTVETGRETWSARV